MTASTIDVLLARLQGRDCPVQAVPKALPKTPSHTPSTIDKVKGDMGIHPPVQAQKQSKDALRRQLQVGIWWLEFTKLDGSHVTMEATLDPRVVPKSTTVSVKPEGDHMLRFFSPGRGWRTLLLDNLSRCYQLPETL